MRRLLAVIAVLPFLAWGCANVKDAKPQSTLNEAVPTTGTGNTGAAGTAAAGPSMNSQSATEARREGLAR